MHENAPWESLIEILKILLLVLFIISEKQKIGFVVRCEERSEINKEEEKWY
jgi:hypothetical protein